ncbi:MAG: phage tail protein [Pseudonocardiaceae bacterium]
MNVGKLVGYLKLDDTNFSKVLRRAKSDVKDFGSDLVTAGSKAVAFGAKLGGAAIGALKPVVSLGMSVATIGSAALTAAPAVATAAQAVGTVLSAAGAASPALLAFAAAGLFVKATFGQIGPSIAESLSPIGDSFDNAGVKAGNLAQQGIRPLADEFARLNMPTISGGMDRIALSTNGVVRGFLNWANSAPGVSAIRSIVDSTASAVERVAPNIERFGISLVSMIGRISGVSLAAGSNGLAGVLDKLSEKMDRVNEASVQNGLSTLKDTYITVRDAVRAVVDITQRAIAFYREYRVEIGLLQDALAILAIAFGGPAVAVIAAVSLIIRHWDQLTAAWQGVVEFFTTTDAGTSFMTSLRTAAETIVPPIMRAFEAIKAAVLPVLQDIWAKVQNDVIPTLGAFLAAISPIVAFLIDILGPVVADILGSIVSIIRGAIDIITGIIKVFTGILTGDWSLAWEGVKQILSGAVEVILGLLNLFIFGRIAKILGSAIGFVGGFFGKIGQAAWDAITRRFDDLVGWISGLPGRILSALGNLGSLLWNSGVKLVSGFWDGIVSRWNAMLDWVRRGLANLRALWPFSPAKEGPFSGQGYVTHSGKALTRDFARSILAGLPTVLASASAVMDAVQSRMAAINMPTLRGLASQIGEALSGSLAQSLSGSLSDSGKAAQEMLTHLNRGGTLGEDFSYRGQSGLVADHNDAIAAAYYRSGSGDPKAFLADYIKAGMPTAQGRFATIGVPAPPASPAGTTAGAPPVIRISSDGRLADLLVEILRHAIQTQGGGNVQRVLGG